MTILEHYSFGSAPLDLARVDADQIPGRKPRGLWLSVPGPFDWPSFARAEYPDGLGPHRHLVELEPDARLLTLATREELSGLGSWYPNRSDPSAAKGHHYGIDWTAMSLRWDGIMLPVHHRSASDDLAAAWHYMWDCACACVWRSRAVSRTWLAPDPRRPKAA